MNSLDRLPLADPRQMSGEHLRAIREALGLDQLEFGRQIGYTGVPGNIRNQVSRMETGRRPIPASRSLTAQLMLSLHKLEQEAAEGGEKAA